MQKNLNIQLFQIKKEYELREMAGEFHVFKEDDWKNGAIEGIPSFNELGIFLWFQLQIPKKLEDLVIKTMERNQCDYDDAVLDTQEFLAKLIHAGVIEYLSDKS
jgi:hypothetical protein